MSSNSFDKFNTIRKLNYAGNKIEFLPKTFLQRVSGVQDLNMEHNNLKELKRELFYPSQR